MNYGSKETGKCPGKRKETSLLGEERAMKSEEEEMVAIEVEQA